MGFMEASIQYSGVEDVNVISRWDAGQKFCIRITVSDGSVLLQVGLLEPFSIFSHISIINTMGYLQSNILLHKFEAFFVDIFNITCHFLKI